MEIDENSLKRIALMMAFNCVTSEAEASGLPSENLDMFNRSIVNNIFTFLNNWIGEDENIELLFDAMKDAPDHWPDAESSDLILSEMERELGRRKMQ